MSLATIAKVEIPTTALVTAVSGSMCRFRVGVISSVDGFLNVTVYISYPKYDEFGAFLGWFYLGDARSSNVGGLLAQVGSYLWFDLDFDMPSMPVRLAITSWVWDGQAWAPQETKWPYDISPAGIVVGYT